MSCANGAKVYGKGKGTAVCESLGMTVSNVMYVSKLSTKLLSVSTYYCWEGVCNSI